MADISNKTSWTQLPTPASCSAISLAGDLLATAHRSAEGPCVQIWDSTASLPGSEREPRSTVQVKELPLHLAWAHPESGLLLAAATQSGAVYILEAPRPTVPPSAAAGDPWAVVEAEGEEEPLHERPWRVASTLQASSAAGVSYVGFAPRQYGLVLCVCCADGLVTMWEADRPVAPNAWCLQAKFKAGPTGSGRGRGVGLPGLTGCVGVSWRSFSPGLAPLLAVGTANTVEIWQHVTHLMTWQRVTSLPFSSPDAVCTSVHWAPSLGRPADMIAAAHGHTVDLWSLQGDISQPDTELMSSLQHNAPVWKVEFNKLGTVLAAGTENGQVHLWQLGLVGTWLRQCVIQGSSTVHEDQGQEGPMMALEYNDMNAADMD